MPRQPRRPSRCSEDFSAFASGGRDSRRLIHALALLYQTARDPWSASEHFLTAALVASSRFATREALAFARKGLACLALVRDRPDVEQRELALQKALLHPLAVLDGYADVAAACSRS